MHVRMNSVLSIMKFAVLFLLLTLAFDETESQKLSQEKVVCAKKDEIINVLKGRDGPSGPPGLKGNRGEQGDEALYGLLGDEGLPGVPGLPGRKGRKGMPGNIGEPGLLGFDGNSGRKGAKGQPGLYGEDGYYGLNGKAGHNGKKGEPGSPGLLGAKIKDDIVISLLNDYYVAESGYYNNLYHVKSRDLTDGRTDTGGWGSETAKTGNYIQATFVRPIYVTSVTVAGGFIPSWGHDTKQGYGLMDLEYSDGETWHKISNLETPVGEEMVTRHLTVPVVAQYWRLISTENKWVGITEFALKPLLVKSPVLDTDDE